MTTVSQLIDDCSGMLHSYTGTVEASTFLTTSITETDETIPVAHPTRLLQGIIEIGDELLQVSDAGEASVELFPNGRGVMNTTAVPHAVNTRVVNDPLVPRARLFSDLRATILQVQRDLWVVRTEKITSTPTVTTYEIPEDTLRILKVQYEAIGTSKEWPAIHNWTVDHHAEQTSGKAIVIRDCIPVGRSIQVTYAAPLPVPATPTDDLEALGIPPEWHDVINYGACWRSVQMMAPGRLNLRSVEQQTLATGVTPDSVAKVAQQFFGLFQLRREEERRRLNDTYPPRPHRVR